MAELLPQHAELIDASAISPQVAAARGYRSVTSKEELKRLGFSDRQAREPALVIPLHDVHGGVPYCIARPDAPRVDASGRPVKYETPRGARMVLDVPPGARARLGDPRVPLFVTEGARKADAAVSAGSCCVSLIGVWCWRGTNEYGGKTLLPDFEAVALNERDVFVVFDSDVMQKEAVHASLERFAPVLKQFGARVRLVYLPAGENGAKVGLDDFLAAGGSPDELVRLAEDDLRPLSAAAASRDYEATERGIVWHKPARGGGRQPVLLTNFVAEIVADTVRDDGAETTRWFTVEARVHGRRERFEVEAASFGDMRWVLERVGADAIIDGAPGMPARARAAIQALSGVVPQQRRYAHTGWRELDDGLWVYLHAGGAIGADGPVDDVAVELPVELERFELPAPPEGERLVAAVEASLRLLELAPPAVTVPLVGAVYRAPLGSVDLSEFLAGPTGVFKTELAALAQQHWGARLDARHLAVSWSSTANWTEAVLFAAKDALCVVDDFAPGGTSIDVSRAHRDADRVFRSQGNRAGRGRMRADASLRRATIPRALPIATGEDVPRGQSLQARLVIVNVAEGDIESGRLSAAQDDAGRGLYAAAMAGYVRWIAARYADLQTELPAVVRRLRDRAPAGAHRRTATNEANLAAGFHYFLDFAEQIGAIDAGRRLAIFDTVIATLADSGEAQAAHHVEADPVHRFLDLLAAEISAGRAHTADIDGTRPLDPRPWGWRIPPNESDWRPYGRRVGWLDGDELYLDPNQTYACVQQLADQHGERIPLDLPTLTRRLHEAGLLASTNLNNRRRTYRVRRTVQDRRRDVLHLKAAALEPRALPDQPPAPPTTASDPTVSRPDGTAPAASTRSDQPTAVGNPTGDPTPANTAPDAPNATQGRIGRIPEQDTPTGSTPPTRAADARATPTPCKTPDQPDQPDLEQLLAAGPQAVTDAVLRALPWPPNPPVEGTSWSEDL